MLHPNDIAIRISPLDVADALCSPDAVREYVGWHGSAKEFQEMLAKVATIRTENGGCLAFKPRVDRYINERVPEFKDLVSREYIEGLGFRMVHPPCCPVTAGDVVFR